MQNFDKSNIYLEVEGFPGLVMRAARIQDLETLRVWKNDQKAFFFYQIEISPDQQMHWFEGFVTRPYDLMFLVEYGQTVFGCMGVRWKEEHWDIYNVILGIQAFGKRGLMGMCFQTLLSFAYSLHQAPITLQVLSTNPAVTWYEKQGFKIIEEHKTYFSMRHKNFDSMSRS